MSKILLAIIIALSIPNTVYAQNNEEICSEISTLAREIMKARQTNAPIIELKEIVNNDKKLAKEGKEVINSLIELAYSRPRFSSEENQQNEIVDFQNEIYLHCITNLNK